MTNIFDAPMPAKGQEDFTELFSGKNVAINRIVSAGLKNGEWYDQDEDEWLVLLEGSALLECGEEEKALRQGDILFIPAHQKHRVKRTSEKALWLTVHIR